MEISNNIFRNYDIRGIYPSEINENIAVLIGRAFGTVLRKTIDSPKVVVGRDDRASSPSILENLIIGLVSTGCQVTDVGITITPAIHFFTVTEEFDMGINVTASHNPKDFTGFRIDYKNAKSFYGDLIMNIRFLIERGAYEYGEGTIEKKYLNVKYMDYLKKKFKFKTTPKIVIDCGSGATSHIAPKVFEDLGCKVITAYCNFDSNFPHGVPNPEDKLFMEDLSEHVLQSKAQVGLAYDTDGDRFGMVDEKGNIYDTDTLLLLFAKDVLKKNKGAKIVYDVKCSSTLDNYIARLGGVPQVMRTGHPYFTDAVEGDALIGAEYAGHIYFSDRYFGYDDGLYASLRLVELIDRSKKPLSEMMAEFPKRVSTGEMTVNCPDDLKFKVVNLIKIYVTKKVKYKHLVDIDGVRVVVSDTGWFLIRASNTSPYLSIRAEGENKEELESLLKIVRDALKSVSIIRLDLSS